jgi:charged multivesicular body protein 4
MSIFQRLFGGSKKNDPNNISSAEAVQRLSSVEEILSKKQEHLEGEIENEKANALRCSKQGNKRGALMALKRKKKHENTLKQIDGTLTTLELQRESLQNASSNMEVLRVMRQAAGALKKSNQNLDVDGVHDLMDDLDEQNKLCNDFIYFK